MASRESSKLNSTRKRDLPDGDSFASRANPDAGCNFRTVPNTRNIGTLGENLVSEWLQQQGWEILHRQYRCRWGEIDIIALGKDTENAIEGGKKNSQLLISLSQLPTLAFVEVKTRSRGNWDAGGMLAVSAAKQAKLWQTAEIFLSNRLDLVNNPCRFDVALVKCESLRPNTGQKLPSTEANSSPALAVSYRLTLQEYIRSAFTS
ncbi:MAG: YraN family protein [Microcoleus sp.]